MRVLVAYDVATADKAGERRLRRVAQACKDYGQRVQKSLFECMVGPTEWVALRARLLGESDAKMDSLRFYFLEGDVRVEHHGTNRPWDFEAGLVV
jgi:CRISPR-associated protein Cas2